MYRILSLAPYRRLAVCQDPYAYIRVKAAKTPKYVMMVNNGHFVHSIKVAASIVYLRTITSNTSGRAKFAYSPGWKAVSSLGNQLQMKFSLKIFTGNKFCLCNYATREVGGYVDFDWFRVK
ncbi:MAG: hypothetical protein EOO00_07970 [Chitinophagaceae bacterium]|nr:MAG: hypothetical protein EOO00_07970 [Chitinophagaceae bacterium]